MHFQVPQFIDIQDKIIGPLTLKQFMYLAGGVMVLAVLWFCLELGLFILVAIPVIFLCLAFAFYKINGRPFVCVLGAFIIYFTKPKLYLWKKDN